METLYSPQQTHQKSSNSQRNKMTLKIVFIGILIVLLIIPVLMISNLISERENTASDAVKEVHKKWSGKQLVIGPVITIPIKVYDKDKDSFTRSYINILPEELDITGKIETQQLNRGIYDIVVYNSPLNIQGKFKKIDWNTINVKKEQLILSEASVNIGISDLRGISEQVILSWNGDKLTSKPGVDNYSVVNSGVSFNTDLKNILEDDGEIYFSFTLKLKGSQSLLFAPIGKTTNIDLTSNCANPSFVGSFLPDNREVTDEGFTSNWKILDLNRNFPQILVGLPSNSSYYFDGEYSSSLSVNSKFTTSIFGVNLLFSVDQYQKSMRSLKYAFLIIILTFVVCFFVEIFQKKNIHPFQYLLVGLALCLFYTLLIAFSEHTGFSIAYLLSSVMTTGLITFYMMGILKIKKTATTIGILLAALYGYIFFLIQLESYALLAGSIGLFVILSIVMYYSQKINWYSGN